MGFDAARRAAFLSDVMRLLRGRPAELLPFDQVRQRLKLKRLVDRGVREVSLDEIVGSLGRAREFNRAFLPRREALRQRWTEVEGLARGAEGYPPVDLYKVGDAYFVVDGHHRVSVARSVGARTIEARVREFLTPVRIDPDSTIDDVLLEGGLADFLDATGLGPRDPDEYRVTTADGYQRLLEHINVHAYYRWQETGRDVRTEEAVESWRDTVFRPMVDAIRSSGIMQEFPGRTETDLYLFTMDHLHGLRERRGSRTVRPQTAVRHLRLVRRTRPRRGRGAKVRRTRR
jgi:hypothetical protein